MKNIIKLELAYFVIIFIFLALMQHPDLLTSPIVRVNKMIELGNYLHPFVWTSVFYILIALMRSLIKFANHLKSKKK